MARPVELVQRATGSASLEELRHGGYPSEGRTHLDLAELAHARGDREASAGHLAEARSAFTLLRVPTYLDRTGSLATRLGLPSARRSAAKE